MREGAADRAPAPDRVPFRLWLLLLVLGVASVWPALHAFRIVRSYARIPRIPIRFEKCVVFEGDEPPADLVALLPASPSRAPDGVVSSGGARLVVSAAGDRVRAFDSRGVLIADRPLTGHAGALSPAPGGRTFLADASTGRVWVLDAEGRELGLLARGDDVRLLPNVRAVSAAPDGAFWVVGEGRACRLSPVPAAAPR